MVRDCIVYRSMDGGETKKIGIVTSSNLKWETGKPTKHLSRQLGG